MQTRSLKERNFHSETSGEYFIESPTYSDLLTFLKNRKTNRYENDDDTNEMTPRKEQVSFFDRRRVRLDNIPSRYAGRPSNSFGRKSHWDTFFG